jgi:predicted aldo/keto reductase-like oxidoreductase
MSKKENECFDRRVFLKTSALAMLGTHASVEALCETTPSAMQYRQLGRTGLKVSEISLGGSPVPSEPVFKKAIERGVNYIDTSSSYMNGNSERLIGKLIRSKRERFHVATKFHPGRKQKTQKQLIEEAEGSLERLGSDYVDILLCHGASNPEVLESEELLGAFDQLKKQGKIRFTGVSCHVDPVRVLTPAIQSGNYDMITLGYNAYSGTRIEKDKVYDDYLVRSGIHQVIALAQEKGVGVVAMKTMAGGNRQNLTSFKAKGVSLAQAKLKWVLQNQAVSAVITEMLTFEMLEENLAVSGQKPSPEEEEALKEYVRKRSKEYCRMCGTCLAGCPSGIAIPDVLRYVAYYRGYGKPRTGRAGYRRLSLDQRYPACKGCGSCEARCPYGLPIRQKLVQAHNLLG